MGIVPEGTDVVEAGKRPEVVERDLLFFAMTDDPYVDCIVVC